MASSGGKRSTKKICDKRYSGASASQQVRAAEWTGQLAWNPNNHAGSRSSDQAPWPEDTTDYSKPWFEEKEGAWYCLLCKSYATEGHLASEKHKNREQEPSYYGFPLEGEENRPVEKEWDQPWFEQRDGEWYCLLCNQWANTGHLTGKKHMTRQECPEYYGYARPGGPAAPSVTAADGKRLVLPKGWEQHMSQEYQRVYYHNKATGESCWEAPEGTIWEPVEPGMASAAAAAAATDPAQPLPIWIEMREGERFCRLCNQWATDGHLASAKHTKREETPEWYLDDDLQQPAQTPVTYTGVSSPAATAPSPNLVTAASPTNGPQAPPNLPPPWEAHWDTNYGRFYFYNAETAETSWTEPAASAEKVLEEEC